MVYSIASLGVLLLASWLIYLALPEDDPKPNTLTLLRNGLGLSGLHPIMLIAGAFAYAIIAAILTVGLAFLILGTIALPFSEGMTPKELRDGFLFYVLRLAGLTTVLGAVIALPITVIRLRLTQKQTDTATESLFNEKINAATQGLYARRQISILGDDDKYQDHWQDDIVQRCAAIDRLARLARANPEEALSISRTIATYIRVNFPAKNLDATPLPFERKQPRADLQIGIQAIGSTNLLAREHQHGNWRLDLRSCDFDGVDFSNGNFLAVDFSRCRIEAAQMNGANLQGVKLSGCLLNCTTFWRSDLTGASLGFAIISLEPGGLFQGLRTAHSLRGVSFVASDLRGMHYLGKPSQISETFGTKDTQLHLNVRAKKPSDSELSTFHVFKDGSPEQQDEVKFHTLKHGVLSTGYQHWSPYDSTDGATHSYYVDFLKELGMDKWPYIDS
ncbi:pentapeptide repeat-containing protein [Tateyamaria sp.]|uniref:pentapeptide repeat-containing protein n=1 Tax=Tateyamaria sp. TaxID=1929288 RepID=UPI00329AB5DE